MAAVGYQIFLTGGKINEFNLQMISRLEIVKQEIKIPCQIARRDGKKNT
jgi:hypothetical protein